MSAEVRHRRRLRFSLRILFTLILVIAVALAILVASRDPIVNRSSYSKIELGMNESTVDAILKGTSVELSPLNYEDVVYDESLEALLFEYPPPHTIRSWISDGYMITVTLDRDRRVASKYYKRAPNASLVDRLADWLGI